MFRNLIAELRENKNNQVNSKLCLVGAKAAQFFRSIDVDVVAAATHLGEDPQVEDLVGSIKTMLDEYIDGNIDQLFIVHNNFVNTMTQNPR